MCAKRFQERFRLRRYREGTEGAAETNPAQHHEAICVQPAALQPSRLRLRSAVRLRRSSPPRFAPRAAALPKLRSTSCSRQKMPPALSPPAPFPSARSASPSAGSRTHSSGNVRARKPRPATARGLPIREQPVRREFGASSFNSTTPLHNAIVHTLYDATPAQKETPSPSPVTAITRVRISKARTNANPNSLVGRLLARRASAQKRRHRRDKLIRLFNRWHVPALIEAHKFRSRNSRRVAFARGKRH